MVAGRSVGVARVEACRVGRQKARRLAGQRIAQQHGVGVCGIGWRHPRGLVHHKLLARRIEELQPHHRLVAGRDGEGKDQLLHAQLRGQPLGLCRPHPQVAALAQQVLQIGPLKAGNDLGRVVLAREPLARRPADELLEGGRRLGLVQRLPLAALLRALRQLQLR